MNIWIVNQYALTPSQAGGTRHHRLATELIKLGHEVRIIASSFSYTTRKETQVYSRRPWLSECVEGVPFLWLRTPPYDRNSLARIKNMLVFGYRVLTGMGTSGLSRPDVIIGSSPQLFATWAAYRLAKRLNATFVLEVRDIWPQSLIDLGNVSERHIMSQVLALIEQYLYRNARKIVSVLPHAEEHMVSKGAVRQNIHWIPNGVTISAKSAGIESYSKVKEPFIVMYTGAHGLANGLDLILDAAALISHSKVAEFVRFQFIGDGPHKSRLMERSEREKLENVTFHPPVSSDKIRELLKQASATVIVTQDVPLYRHGISPNKLFEYFAAEKPVVLTINTKNNPVDEAQAGYSVPPGDAQALAHAVERLATTSVEELMLMGRRGRRYVETNHDIAKLAATYERVLYGALNADNLGEGS